MKIAIDIDDTLAQTLYFILHQFNLEHDTDYIPDSSKTNFIQDLLKDQYYREYVDAFIIRIMKEKFHQIDIFPHAKDVILALKKKHSLIILTSRGQDLREETFEWLKQHNIYDVFDDIQLLNKVSTLGGKDKGEACQKLGITVLIEDSVSHILSAADKGVKVFVRDRPWNRHIEHENVIRFFDWSELLEKI